VIESNTNMFPSKSNMDFESKQMWDMNNKDPSQCKTWIDPQKVPHQSNENSTSFNNVRRIEPYIIETKMEDQGILLQINNTMAK